MGVRLFFWVVPMRRSTKFWQSRGLGVSKGAFSSAGYQEPATTMWIRAGYFGVCCHPVVLTGLSLPGREQGEKCRQRVQWKLSVRTEHQIFSLHKKILARLVVADHGFLGTKNLNLQIVKPECIVCIHVRTNLARMTAAAYSRIVRSGRHVRISSNYIP